MAPPTITIEQPLFKAPCAPIQVTHVQERGLTDKVIDAFLQSADDFLGIAAGYGQKGVLDSVALASSTNVLHIQLTPRDAKSDATAMLEPKKPTKPSQLLRDKVLCNPSYGLLGFDMHRSATALFLDHGIHITLALDLQSILPRRTGRSTLDAFLQVLGGEIDLNKAAVVDTFFGEAAQAGTIKNVSLRAWASHRVSKVPKSEQLLMTVSPIDTLDLDPTVDLTLLSNLVRIADRLYALKPTKTKHDVESEFNMNSKTGELSLESSRFKTRLRTTDGSQRVVINTSSAGGNSTAAGRAGVSGRAATVRVTSNIPSTAKILSVITIGREVPTNAEDTRQRATLAILQRKSDLLDMSFVKRIYLNSGAEEPRNAQAVPQRKAAPTVFFPARALNISQTLAVERILSEEEDDRICLIHGPPGTGKTTVMAACVTSIVNNTKDDRGIWLVAQSNVAVKNIAEKLAEIGFLDFKLIVSKDFHFDWHEHLYEDVLEANLIRSDDFVEDTLAISRLLLGSRVILATLNMLSHPRLMTCGFHKVVPLNIVIVDEASQIEIGDYLPLLYHFGKDVRKLAFIGDHKQLAPYGQDDLGEVPSIFDVAQLRENAVFLDTQYRMPEPIGNFISQHVYDGRLKTSHAVSSRRSCRFVDVHMGKEQKKGNSWINDKEADVVVNIAKKLHSQGKSFRIITPYDSQRNLLEGRLKTAKLPWENKCFNVDSFQGNEEDHIIISVVRSQKVGFLANLRRTNVMLSRCKKSMIICSSRAFLSKTAATTLVGKLASEWGAGPGSTAWLGWREVLTGNF